MSPPTQPIAGVGAIVFHDDAVLLVKRTNPPNAGQWAIPGGKVKLGETLQQAAERELLEETGVHIRAGEVIYQFEIIEHDTSGNVQWHFIILDLAAIYISGEPAASDDVSEARWITRTEFTNFPINEVTQKLLREKYDFP
jgi:8-oxo-dGTP diphosphatase